MKVVTQSDSDRNMSSAGLRAFFRIMELWGVKGKDAQVLLGSIPHSTYYNWKANQNVKLQKDTLERISYILGIYKGLQVLFSDADTADKWVKKNNSAALFRGKTALDMMLSGNVADLFQVRRYIDAVRGGVA